MTREPWNVTTSGDHGDNIIRIGFRNGVLCSITSWNLGRTAESTGKIYSDQENLFR